MLTELRRCNSIGNIDGLLFLVSILRDKDKVSKVEIGNRCTLENGVSINCPGAIAFLQYLGFVTTDCENVYTTEAFNDLSVDSDKVLNAVTNTCINHLIEDGLFDLDTVGFNTKKGHLSIKRSAFPLSYAAIRNFLTLTGVLGKEELGEIGLEEEYESDFVSKLKSRKNKLTLEQLLKKQEEQNKRGLEAEEFVLALEKQRLPSKATKVKRISDYDVTAGYDIVSFQNNESDGYNRFIEVKCYIGEPHFYWSENESDVARIKGSSYTLCLVDYSQINNPSYVPQYIDNPYDIIFNDETWLVTTSTYKVQKI